MVTNTGWYGQVGVFLEAFFKWVFGFTYVQGPGRMLSRIIYDPKKENIT